MTTGLAKLVQRIKTVTKRVETMPNIRSDTGRAMFRMQMLEFLAKGRIQLPKTEETDGVMRPPAGKGGWKKK